MLLFSAVIFLQNTFRDFLWTPAVGHLPPPAHLKGGSYWPILKQKHLEWQHIEALYTKVDIFMTWSIQMGLLIAFYFKKYTLLA